MQKQTGQAGRTTTARAAGGRPTRRRPPTVRSLLTRMPASMLEALPHAALLYAADGTLAHMNAAADRLFGSGTSSARSDRQLPYSSRIAPFHPRTLPGIPLDVRALPLARVLAGETIPASEAVVMRLTLPGKGDVLISCSGSPLLDDAGQVIGALLLAEPAAARDAGASDVLGSVFDVMSDPIVVLNEKGEVVRRNEAARQMFYDATEADFSDEPLAERRHGFELLAADGSVLAEKDWPAMRILRGERVDGAHTQDISYLTRTGQRLWLNASGVPLREGDRITGAVIVYRDVTERRLVERHTDAVLDALLEMAELVVQVPEGAAQAETQAEAQAGTQAGTQGETAEAAPSVEGGERPSSEALLARAELAAARQIAELTRRVLACSRVGIVAVDLETRRQRAIAVVGLKPEQERAWWIEQESLSAYGEGSNPEDLARFEAGEIFIVDMTKPPYDALPNPYNIATVAVAPMRVGGKLVGFLSLDHSGAEHTYTARELQLIEAVARLGALVIERERLFRERAQAQADLLAAEEANQRMATFLSLASHELRTPVTSMLPNVEVLLRRVRVAATHGGARERQSAEAVERVYRQTARLKRLIDNLLDVSRIHENRLELEVRRMDLGALAREMVAEVAGVSAERVVTVAAPEEAVEVLGDALRLGQAVTNFLTNALKYSPADQPVHVRVLREPTCARVEVRDSGQGIPEEEQVLIWNLWHRAEQIKASGSGVNLGLGLHITRTIVERHGGAVGVESAPGEGSTFWFTVPLVPRDGTAV